MRPRALTHKESSGNEGYHGNEHESVARRRDVALCSDISLESAVRASQSQLRFGVKPFSRFFGVIASALLER